MDRVPVLTGVAMKIGPLAAIFLGVASVSIPGAAQVKTPVRPVALTPSGSTADSTQVSQMLQQYEAVHTDIEGARESLGDDNPQMRPLRALERRLVNGLMELVNDRDRAADRYRASLNEIQQVQGMINAHTGRVDVSPEGLRSALRSLEDQRQSLVIELAGAKARRDAIQQMVAVQSAKAADVAQNDPVTRELKEIVDIQQTKLDQKVREVDHGAGNKGEVLDAESALAEAQIKLAEHGRDSTSASVAGLNEKLTEMTVDEAERQATLQAVNDQLDKLGGVSSRIDELELLQSQLIDAEADLRQAEIDARLVEREFAISPPILDTTQPATTQAGGSR
jgi:chromosome segregation ATPase